MTVEEVIGQVRVRVYDQVVVTESGQGTEMEVGPGGMGESGFVVRYGRDAVAVVANREDHGANLMLSESSLADGNGSSGSSDGVMIENSDVTGWTTSQQDYTELVYLCKYATTTQPPPAPLTNSDSNSNSSGGDSVVGGLQPSTSVHVPQLALLVMNEPNPETSGRQSPTRLPYPLPSNIPSHITPSM